MLAFPEKMKLHRTSLSAAMLAFSVSVLFLSITLLSFLANARIVSHGNETDRLALLNLKELVSGDPDGVFSSWNDSNHFCNWHGVTCGHRHERVVALDLQGHNLKGLVSPYIGNLTFLRSINLGNNSFHGEIPWEVGHLYRLTKLNLQNNTLGGKIPVDLANCTKLRILRLWNNKLIGNIPIELGSLKELRELAIPGNQLTGSIPTSLGNLSSLASLSVALNRLAGKIPEEIGLLKNLSFFSCTSNQLSGKVPSSIYNISSIKVLSIPDNRLEGTLPENVGLTLPNLQFFGIGENYFSGPIPVSITNASLLQILDVSFNNFVGQVPVSVGSLSNLSMLLVGANNLGGDSVHDMDFLTPLINCSKLEDLDFTTNNFSGTLPNSIANLSTQLTYLYFGENHLSGNIPADIANLVSLIVLAMDNNLFTGSIPPSFSKFGKMQTFYLGGNRLSGQIPDFLGNLSELSNLFLEGNYLEGSIPRSIGNCKKLQFLSISENNLSGSLPGEIFDISSLSVAINLSQNSLSGDLPQELGNLKSISTLDFSKNNFSGEIPETVKDCLSLVSLALQENAFEGTIPLSLVSLKGLHSLDLSQNKLTGRIPKELQRLPALLYLNLSFNDLEGEVPTDGVFKNSTAISVIGNPRLCGGIPQLQLPACLAKVTRKRKFHVLVLGITSFCSVLGLILIVYLGVIFLKRKSKQGSEKAIHNPLQMSFFAEMSYSRLYDATGGFSLNNLVGSGSFGSVFCGALDQGESIAVKVFNLQQKGATKSFVSECKALSNIRHRNLVKIISCCSSIDFKGNEFKAIVLKLMKNGSLERWLHPDDDGESSSMKLDIHRRLNIAIDIASALHYLHEGSEIPIIHCDLKPSNILLDEDMVAHVTDFGLARLLLDNAGPSEGQTSTVGLKGTIGYAAPEYGVGAKASKEGDVYSFGVVVLEMFTGRRPTDEMFKDGVDLHQFVKMAMSGRLVEVIDPTLFQKEVEEEEEETHDEQYFLADEIEVAEERYSIVNPMQIRSEMEQCLISILNIGIACSMESPSERILMGDAVRQLHQIRTAFLRSGTCRATTRTAVS